MPVPKSISIELEVEGDPTSLFVPKIDGAIFAEHLTAAQTHLLVGDFLERIALPNKARTSAVLASAGAAHPVERRRGRREAEEDPLNVPRDSS